MRTPVLAVALILLAAPLAPSARGERMVALKTDSDLVIFDTDDVATIESTVAVTGLGATENLIGIDFEPGTNTLWAVSHISKLYTIDLATGAATEVATLSGGNVIGSGSSWFGLDVHPQTGEIHVTGDSDIHWRVESNGDVNADPAMAFGGSDVNSGEDPDVVVLAFSDSYPGSTGPTLYGIDYDSDVLVQFSAAPPSVATTIGPLGVDIKQNHGFEITPDGVAYAILQLEPVTPYNVYSIDLGTGTATLIGELGGGGVTTRGLTWIPDPDDLDTDGFPTRVEGAFGTDADDRLDTPFEDAVAPATTVDDKLVKTLKIKLDHASAGNDAIKLKGKLAVEKGWKPKDVVLVVDVGGEPRAFTLDKKGKGTVADGKIKVSKTRKNGYVSFTMKLKQADLAASFADEGLEDETVADEAVNVEVGVWMSPDVFGETAALEYDSTAGSSGKAK